MTKNVKWGLIVIIVLIIIGMVIYPKVKEKIITSQQVSDILPPILPASRTQVLAINAEIILPQSLSDKIVSVGSTIPDEEVDLSFESSGKIVAFYFQEGTHVKEGDLLAKINDKPLQAQLKKLTAEVPLAGDRVYRQRTLLEKDAVSQEAYEQVTTEYEKLMADIELVKANIAQTELRAPFDGIIGLRYVSEGAYATPSTMIVRHTRISPLKIEFSINENHSSDVKVGTNILFFVEDAQGKSYKYPAKVYAVESKIDTDTRTLKVRALYPNQDETIVAGRYASVEITKREIKDALTIPAEAIIPEMGKNIVYMYREGVAQASEIITGIRTESRVQVLDGINVGDTVITTGVMQLRTGMKVSINNFN